MENFQKSILEAKKRIQVADHMLTMTYQVVKDPKILLSVLDNTFLALSFSLSSIIEYERLFKRVPVLPDTFQSNFNIFKTKVASRYEVNKEYVLLIQEVSEVLSAHKKSPIEFSREDKFVICSENYRMKTIGIPDLKKNIVKTKMFISEIERLVNKNARIFK